MEKGWRKKFDAVKDRITDGYRRGVCDSSGRTVKTASGRPIAQPRTLGSRVKTICGKCKEWYYIKEGHTCEN